MMRLINLACLLVLWCTAKALSEPREVKLAHATNDLAFDLLKSYRNEKNVFISPFSISTALGMVYLGAAGSTAQAIRHVLKYDKYDLQEPDVHLGFQNFLTQVRQNSEDYQLSSVNHALVQQDFIILHMYGHALQQFYSAHIQSVDFATQGEVVKAEINSLVDEATRGKIKNFLENAPDESTKLFLLNAVYFLGNWKDQFDERSTIPATFYNNGVQEKQVQTMNRVGRYQYSLENDLDVSVVVLPYKGNNSASLVIVLPHEKTGITDVQQKLTQESLDQILANTRFGYVRLSVPKFKLDYSTELSDSLTYLGLDELFGDNADLSRMAGEHNQLKVSKVTHKAVIQVDEKGSEAAAATGVEINSRSGIIPGHIVKVDHPFLFFIREHRNGMILFSGRVDEL